MNIFKKNQVVIYAIALMLVVAGYLNYIENDKTVEISAKLSNNTIGDATLVNSNDVKDDNSNGTVGEEKEASNVDTTNISIDNQNQELNKDDALNEAKTNYNEQNETTVSNNTYNKDDEYFTTSKLEREKMYSQMLETYQKILDNSNISEEQKAIATQEIKKINDIKNAIMICENLISIKGFTENIIFVNEQSINIVIKAEELTPDEISQIQNIITREMNVQIENIHIMKK